MRACGSTEQVIPSHIMDLDWINVVQALTRRETAVFETAVLSVSDSSDGSYFGETDRPFGYLVGIDVSKCT
jgi:hypothetical protein